MALARNFQEVVFLRRVKSTGLDEDILTTGGRFIGFTVDEQLAMGITYDTDIVRLRVAGTKDVRKLVSGGVTQLRVNEKVYESLRKVEDFKPGFIDFYLKG